MARKNRWLCLSLADGRKVWLNLRYVVRAEEVEREEEFVRDNLSPHGSVILKHHSHTVRDVVVSYAPPGCPLERLTFAGEEADLLREVLQDLDIIVGRGRRAA